MSAECIDLIGVIGYPMPLASVTPMPGCIIDAVKDYIDCTLLDLRMLLFVKVHNYNYV